MARDVSTELSENNAEDNKKITSDSGRGIVRASLISTQSPVKLASRNFRGSATSLFASLFLETQSIISPVNAGYVVWSILLRSRVHDARMSTGHATDARPIQLLIRHPLCIRGLRPLPSSRTSSRSLVRILLEGQPIHSASSPSLLRI